MWTFQFTESFVLIFALMVFLSLKLTFSRNKPMKYWIRRWNLTPKKWPRRFFIFIFEKFSIILIFTIYAKIKYKISPISNCANASSILYNRMREEYGASSTNWIGFYFRSSGDTLQLGPFCGQPACQLLRWNFKWNVDYRLSEDRSWIFEKMSYLNIWLVDSFQIGSMKSAYSAIQVFD